VTTVVDYEPLIQAALLDAVDAGSFPFGSYINGRLTVSIDQFGKPASVVAHAESATFGTSHDKRIYRRDRTTWIWTLELTFKGHVALGQFERRLIESPLRVLRDREAGRDQQVTLDLIGSAYQPPPEGQPAGGMRATYRFNATLTPS
jgi:hypothetical protein